MLQYSLKILSYFSQVPENLRLSRVCFAVIPETEDRGTEEVAVDK